MKEGLVRLEVGGKLLTNYLKEQISYRQLNLMDEFMVCQRMKEHSCYCSLDFKSDLMQKEKLKKTYILPNFSLGTPGKLLSPTDEITENDQFIRLCNERFQVPELLFNPSDGLIPQVAMCCYKKRIVPIR